MIIEIQILSNATARLIEEDGTVTTKDLLQPLINELAVANKISNETTIISSLNKEVKVQDWYLIDDKKGNL